MKTSRRPAKEKIEILAVEDSLTQLDKLKHLLKSGGYVVRTACNGKQALEAIQQRKPLLVISDILMPEMDGYDLCQEIKSQEKWKDIPVILLTSLSSAQDVIKGLQCGADNFVRKPYNDRYLLSRVKHILTNRELRKSERFQMGVEIYFGGQKHFITSERQQILDLLISTYEQAVQVSDELAARNEQLAQSSNTLKGLCAIAENLNESKSEKEVLDRALDRMQDLPGVRAAWIFLLEDRDTFRLAASVALPPALLEPLAMEGPCQCMRQLLTGQLRQAINILECERLKKAGEKANGAVTHASVPLWCGEQVLGLLNIVGADEDLFSDDNLKLLRGVGNQIGIALERARLQERLEEKVKARTASLLAEIQERKVAEEAKAALEAQLLQAQKMESIGRLAGGVAHDFNNILMAINAYCELLLMKMPASDSLRQGIVEIHQSAERGSALTRQLLAFSRKQVLELRVLDLNQLISGLEGMLHTLIGEDVRLTVHYSEALKHVKADPGQMGQVIMNLAINARDAMPEGGRLTIETANVDLDEAYSARHVAVQPGRYVMMTVTDTGSGMDEETLSRIFEPFFTTKEDGKGTGLGLSTVYGIVKQSGGTIWVYSHPGRGTTFKVYLPAIEESVDDTAPAAPPVDVTAQGETILLVDDNESVRNAMSALLGLKGYVVLQADHGRAALEIARTHGGSIHLLITDVVMPEMSGLDLAKKVTELRPGTKVLFMSGYTEHAFQDSGVSGKDTGFISKPATMQALLLKIRELLH